MRVQILIGQKITSTEAQRITLELCNNRRLYPGDHFGMGNIVKTSHQNMFLTNLKPKFIEDKTALGNWIIPGASLFFQCVLLGV